MKHAVMLIGIVLAGSAGEAMAICGAVGTDTPISTASGIRGVLSGIRVSAVAPSGELWNEDHCSVGGGTGPANLYKVGTGGTTGVDPRALTGTWEITGPDGSATVKYSYSPTPLVYTWGLWQTGGVVYFCNGSAEIAHVTASGGAGTPCP